MAITANHMIYDIINIASSGGNPNEFKITEEQVLYWIEETRSVLIAQALDKGDRIHDSWIQFINCLELECVDDSDCCLAPSGCYVLRSKKQLPSTIDTWTDNSIISVVTMSGNSIPKSNHIKQRYQQYSKYTKKSRSWFLKDNYLYVINDIQLQYVNVAGLFEFPSELENFVACDGDECWTRDTNYPITIGLATIITDIIIKTKVNPFMQYPMDNSNNANAATPEQNINNKKADT